MSPLKGAKLWQRSMSASGSRRQHSATKFRMGVRSEFQPTWIASPSLYNFYIPLQNTQLQNAPHEPWTRDGFP